MYRRHLNELLITCYKLKEQTVELSYNSELEKRSYVRYLHSVNRFEWFKALKLDIYLDSFISPIIDHKQGIDNIRNIMISTSKRILWSIRRFMYKGRNLRDSLIEGATRSCAKYHQETGNINYLLCCLHVCAYAHVSLITESYDPVYSGIPTKISNLRGLRIATEKMVKYVDTLKSINSHPELNKHVV